MLFPPFYKVRSFARRACSSLLLVIRQLWARVCALIEGGISASVSQEADRGENGGLDGLGAGYELWYNYGDD